MAGKEKKTRTFNWHGEVARWALALQPYQFTVSHRAGTANANADGLSLDQGSQSKDVEMLEKQQHIETLTDN